VIDAHAIAVIVTPSPPSPMATLETARPDHMDGKQDQE
jgi:hypothetical protein